MCSGSSVVSGMAKPPVKVVGPWILRRMFNKGRYWQRAQSGALRQRIRRNGHPSPPLAPEPVCTRSQTVSYLDNSGREVALVHQYVRSDGTLGASGKPDPKRLYENGVLYIIVTP